MASSRPLYPSRSWKYFLDCPRSEEHTSELQSQSNLVCRLLLEKKKTNRYVFGVLCPRRIGAFAVGHATPTTPASFAVLLFIPCQATVSESTSLATVMWTGVSN